MILTFNKKQDLIDALEARRSWCKETDKKRLAAHKVAEREALKEWRALLRDALKWSYEEAANNYFTVGRPSRPSCPSSRVEMLDRELGYLQATRQERFRIKETGHYWPLWFLLVHDDDANDGDMC